MHPPTLGADPAKPSCCYTMSLMGARQRQEKEMSNGDVKVQRVTKDMSWIHINNIARTWHTCLPTDSAVWKLLRTEIKVVVAGWGGLFSVSVLEWYTLSF